MHRLFLSALAAIALIVVAQEAHAGDRELEIIFVNMTPDAESGGDSTVCVNAIKEFVAGDYTRMKSLGETKTRAATGVPKGGAHFLTWKAEQFKSLKEGTEQAYFDAVVLVDCRPAKQLLDILVVNAGDEVAALMLRSVTPKKALLKLIGARAMAHAWGGFVP